MKKKIIIVLCGVILVSVLALAGAFMIFTFEEGKNELEDTADDYLKANKIDPKTAGETGEICPNCGKKIWNPDKYGFFIPGMPDDYENSGYWLGTCGISLE